MSVRVALIDAMDRSARSGRQEWEAVAPAASLASGDRT